jgi:predicted MFS family arabinose efflux permease
VVFAGLLGMLSLTRVGAVAAVVFAVGIAGLAFAGHRYFFMIAAMMVASAGMHLLQPVTHSLIIAMSEENKRGLRLGQMGAMRTLGTILGAGFVWLVFDTESPQYAFGFLCAGAGGLLVAAAYTRLKAPGAHYKRAFIVVRTKFWLYYILEFLFGARKQIFITFGPWVLIHVYEYPAKNIAFLLMVAAALGLLFRPLAGWAMDRLGERTVMVGDGLILAAVCIGYGFAGELAGSLQAALPVAGACYVLDNLLFALGAARTVYVARLADSSEEISSTLALGVSINHIASMVIPFCAGLIWTRLGYQTVFAAAAVLALLVAFFSSMVPGPRAMPG